MELTKSEAKKAQRVIKVLTGKEASVWFMRGRIIDEQWAQVESDLVDVDGWYVGSVRMFIAYFDRRRSFIDDVITEEKPDWDETNWWVERKVER